MSTAQASELVPAVEGSSLALTEARIAPAAPQVFADSDRDLLLYVFEGSGTLTLGDLSNSLAAGTACLVLAGESAVVGADDSGIALVCASVGPEADRHAPLGAREHVVPPEDSGAEKATGARSFRILLGPHNGSTRATLFAGFIPPGKAPWHYHLYDEIVWVPEGPGRLHIGGTIDELGPGSAFRLRPRQVHIVENLSADAEMIVIGVFTPAGSPSAAYLTPDVAAQYRFAGSELPTG